MACYDVAEWIMAPVFTPLISFAAIVMPGSLLVYKPCYYGTYDPRSNRELKSYREKFLEDQKILLERLPEFCTIAQYRNSKVPAEDELTRGLRATMHMKEIPLWLVFAIQYFLDVQHIFRQNIHLGSMGLLRVAAEVKRTMKEHLDYHKTLSIDG